MALVAKNFSITERLRVGFRTEFFNLFNRAGFSNPNSNVPAGTYGCITDWDRCELCVLDPQQCRRMQNNRAAEGPAARAWPHESMAGRGGSQCPNSPYLVARA